MKAISTVTILALIAWVPATPSGRTSVQPSAVLATPLDAVSAVLDAFAEHRVVALGEGPHGNEQGHAFRMKLIQDPRFAERVNDILVEFGSGKYQSLMDRFVQGDLIARDDLKRTWQDTTASGTVWDRPIYEEFFRTVRAVNLSLPKDRQLRVLLGDAPIDWSLVHSHAALRRWGMQKDAHAAALIKNEVLAKGRRALVIFGDGHLQGRPFAVREGTRKRGLTNTLEAEPHRTRVFTISSKFADLSRWQVDAGSWPVPSIAKIRGTPIGQQFFASFYPIPPEPGWNTTRLQDHFDAMLYLGLPSTMSMSRFPTSLCHDPVYMKMRLGRMQVEDIRIRQPTIDILKALCAGAEQ
jgi:hypothetical protein